MMDLRGNRITLGELWDEQKSRAVFKKRIPMLAKHPVKGAARTVTLEQLYDFMSGWVPGMMINGVMAELKKLYNCKISPRRRRGEISAIFFRRSSAR